MAGMYHSSSGDGSDFARQQEQELQQRINEGKADINQKFAGFDDAFYQQRATDYENYAMPQMAEQLHTTRNSLAAQLARRGLMKSGASIESNADLDKFAEGKTREIADTARGEANQLRGDVENSRSNLINQLIASGDPSVASTGALSAAMGIRTDPSFKPLGNLFNDWTEIWGANQVARSYNPQVQPLFSFGGNNKASSYIN